MKIRRLTIDKNLSAPVRETEFSAGYDLRSASIEDVSIFPGGRAVINTGFAWEIPHGCVGMVCPRSGLAVRDGIDIMAGVIDSDYRGEVGVVLINHSNHIFHVNYGDRIAQMVVLGHAMEVLEEVSELSTTERGSSGYGSTGK